jgi:hypothetical protein
MTLQRTAIFALVAAGLIVLGTPAPPAFAQTAADQQVRTRVAEAAPRTRARTRIRVTPDRYASPGFNAVRQCTSWLAEEYRPSGTVIVPHVDCWWERR